MRLFTGYTGRNFEHVENLGRVPTRVLDTAVPISIHTAVLRELVRMRTVMCSVKFFWTIFPVMGVFFIVKTEVY